MNGTDEHIRIRKESNMFNSANEQTPKMSKDKRKEQIKLKSTMKMSNKITEISK
jgi:hypothetical protein